MSMFGSAAEAPAGGRFPARILALRWATVTLGAVLPLLRLSGSVQEMTVTLLLCLYTGFRVIRPLPHPDDRDVPEGAIAVDLGVALAAVSLTGGFGSPYVFVALVPVLLAGFTHGYPGGFVAAVALHAPPPGVGATPASGPGNNPAAAPGRAVHAATRAAAR